MQPVLSFLSRCEDVVASHLRRTIWLRFWLQASCAGWSLGIKRTGTRNCLIVLPPSSSDPFQGVDQSSRFSEILMPCSYGCSSVNDIDATEFCSTDVDEYRPERGSQSGSFIPPLYTMMLSACGRREKSTWKSARLYHSLPTCTLKQATDT